MRKCKARSQYCTKYFFSKRQHKMGKTVFGRKRVVLVRNQQFLFTFVSAAVLLLLAVMVFPEVYLTQTWLLLRSAYLLALCALCCALKLVVRALRQLLIYLREMPHPLPKQRVFLCWLFLFAGLLLCSFAIFPEHTVWISVVLGLYEVVRWWRKRKTAFTFDR
jgi:hypothetical protein